MMTADLDTMWPSYLVSLSTLAGFLVAGLAVRGLLFHSMKKWAARTKTSVDDLLIGALRGPSIIWVLLLAFHFALQTSDLGPAYVRYGTLAIGALLILSVTVFLANLVGKLVSPSLQGLSLPATGLSQAILKGTVLGIGGLVLLSHFGISITPIITALGIGGLAVALALQDTLANLFSGVHILIEKSVRVGDYIKLASGEEGYVVDIGWRTTRIRMLPNNMIIIPNQKLAQAILTNYDLPEKRMSLLIPIGVSYDSDPDVIEQILVDEAKKGANEIPGLLSHPEPFVRFIPGFGDFSLNFTLICQVKEFVDQYLVQHELRKRIFKRFRQEKVEIPFPVRTVYLRESENGSERGKQLGAAQSKTDPV
jgi:small-conductance mechanosensitive channel